MVRFTLLALALVACGKVTDPDVTDAPAPIDAPPDAERLSKPVAQVTADIVAGQPVACTLGTPSTGLGTITYIASWSLDGLPFTSTTTTTIAGDTVPGTFTHTSGVLACTLFATNGTETQVSEPASVTVKPRLAFAIQDGFEGGTSNLLQIDMDTFAVTTIGPLGVTYAFGDIAWDRVNQKLFMVDGRGAESLYTIDITTGAATLIGAHGLADVFGLGFDGTGRLFAGQDTGTTNIQLVNTTSGAMSALGGAAGVNALTFDTRRGLMMGTTGATISTIDLTTGAATVVSPSAGLNNNGFTYDPIIDRFWAMDLNDLVFEYDPTAGFTRQQVTTVTVGVDGLAMMLPPPPP